MEVEVPVLTGYLNVPTQSGFVFSKKKSCQKYCLLFASSRYGIERLEIFESKEDKNPKIITLENCVKITQEPPPANLINIVKKTATLTLNAFGEESLKEWVNALQNVAFRNKTENIQNMSAIEEDNDLYCSSYGDGIFLVSLVPSEASIRCNIEPKCYILQLTATELQLKSTNVTKNIISKWPYRFIRKYGYRDGKFTFEAGRKCSTGEGVFILDYSNPQDVFRCMSLKMKCMKKLISADNCENQLNAAAAMEPGSRSPLPPTFSTQHSVDFESSCGQTLKGLISFDSNNSSINHSPKIFPNKPLRKPSVIPDSQVLSSKIDQYINNEISKQYKNVEPVTVTSTIDPNKAAGSTVILKPSSHTQTDSCVRTHITPNIILWNDLSERDYECIENITEAWRTLGINDVKHIENISDNKNLESSHWVAQHSREKVKDILNTTTTSKMVDIDIGESGRQIKPTDSTYDRLEFLSANNRASSGYKTIVPVAPLAMRTKPTQNEYELINIPHTNSSEKPDDNNMSYGALRKSKNSLLPSDNTVCVNKGNLSIEINTDRQSNVKTNYIQVKTKIL